MRHAARILTLGATLLTLTALAPVARATAPQEARAADTRAEDDVLRETAREVIARENDHLRRRARLERLIDVYRSTERDERVRILQAVRERDELAHRAALARLEQRLGRERYQRLQDVRRAEIAQRVRLVQEQRERAAAASRNAPTRSPAERRSDARVADRPAPRPSPQPSSRPDRPRS